MPLKRSQTLGIVIHRAEVFGKDDYHFSVERDGTIRRIVPIDEKGAHSKDYNGVTVGIAVVGDFAALEVGKYNNPTSEQLDSVVALAKTVNALFGGKLWIAGHSQLGTKGTDVPLKLVPGHTCPGENFPLADIIKMTRCRRFITQTVA